MGIITEYNPDLALRNISEFRNGDKRKEERIPEDIEAGKIYSFLKKGQRNYYLQGEIPLLETKGNQQLSSPKASIVILEAAHFLENGEVYTRGEYKVVEVFRDDEIHFDGFSKIN